jgi:hypothetical protein
MPGYEMPNPKAWLPVESEIFLDSCVGEPEGDELTCFVNVLRRYNPLLPAIITGPLDTFSARLAAFWSNIPENRVEFHQLKSSLLAGFCLRLAGLSILQPGRVETNRLALEGLRFYLRHPSRNPEESPFPHAKRDERLEAAECLYFISLILSTADDNPSPSDTPEALYMPYYQAPQYLTAPKRRNAASLALAVRYFRLDHRGGKGGARVFDFDVSAEQWAAFSEKKSNGEDESPEDEDEAAERLLAEMAGMHGKSSRHGAASYFIIKLMGVMKDFKGVSGVAFASQCGGADLVQQVHNARFARATATHAELHTPLILVSPILMFLRTPFSTVDCPSVGSVLHVSG